MTRDDLLEQDDDLPEKHLAASVAVVDVLANQLRHTARHIEMSVWQVCQHFTRIAQRTRENAANTHRLMGLCQDRGHAGGPQDGDVLEVALRAIRDLIERVRRAEQFHQQTAEHLAEIESLSEQVVRVRKAMGEIDAVSSGLHILALNARMEAARAGEHGVAFGEVATQTGVISRRIKACAESVHEMVGALHAQVQSSTQKITAQMAVDHTEATTCIEQAGLALAALERSHREMRQAVHASAEGSAAVAADIDHSITELQFQDQVNQRVEHVVHALEEVGQALQGYLEGTGCAEQARAAAGETGWIDQLESRYTMLAEREVLADQIGLSTEDHSAPGSIELF